ncbi:MAG TPA: MFS transporter [Stellaceae bacterium]|nr:MFS transporter [Stellaceae bacterium]
MTALAPDPSTSLRRQRSFVLFWCARVAATSAFQMQAVAVGWQIYDLTGSALDLGLVGLVQFVPVVALALVVGHVADRYDRRRVVRIAQLVEAAAAVGLAVGSAEAWLDIRAIFALVFVAGTARAFELPTMHALVPGLVPGHLFSRAVAGSASANQAAVVLGPAVGGLLYAAGPAAVYLTCTALFLGASVLITMVRIEAPARSREPFSLASLFAGFAYIRSRRELVGVISLDLCAVLLGGAIALLPIYARDILRVGPEGLGMLRSAPAVGALASSILLSRHPLQRRVGPILFAAVTCFGAATAVFAVSTSVALSLAALALCGASDAVSVVIRFSLVQTRTPSEMRGRVSSVNSLFVGASNTLGDFEAGLTAAWFGAAPAVLIGGIGAVLVALIWMRIFPELAGIETLDGPAE